jgi:hypothetical protein
MSRIMLVLLILATAIALAQVPASGPAAGPRPGRLAGHVEIGPVTPVERPGHKVKVPPEWYKHYTISITQRGPQSGQMRSHLLKMVKQVKLSGEGNFSVDLNPGPYVVRVTCDSPNKRLPPSQDVMVTAGKTTQVDFHVDSGIR